MNSSPDADLRDPRPPGLADESEIFSPVENDAPFRWWRRLHLAPADGFGAGRRAVLFGLLAWLPIVIWALVAGRLSGGAGEPLLVHYGIHVRCLVVIPLLILAELPLHNVSRLVARQFVSSGVVTEALRPAFDAVVRDVVRLRDTSLPWVFAIGVAVAWAIADPPGAHLDEMGWSLDGDGRIGFGGAWFAYVSRPILVALLVGWLWRLGLVTFWLWRIARLPLALVPAHPDGAGGIGFVGSLPAGFSLVTLALSAMFASGWAHQILHHGAALASFQLAGIAYAVGWTILLAMPLLVFAPKLWLTRWHALPQYAALVGKQGSLVQRIWIDKKDVADRTMLEAEGVGVSADAAVVYEAVAHMRWVPARKETLVAILVPMALPFLVLMLVSMPLQSILKTLLSVLV